MKFCFNKDCFYSTAANEILKENIRTGVIALIKDKGVCDKEICLNCVSTYKR